MQAYRPVAVVHVPKHGHRLPVTTQADAFAPLVVGVLGRTELGGALALSCKAASLAAGRSESAQLSVLVCRLADPVDPWVVADGCVERVHHDDLVPLVHGVLADPIGVENPEAAALSAHALFGN